MPFSAYYSDALRLLSAALSDALDSLGKSKGRADRNRNVGFQQKDSFDGGL
jgi:hypothetical protein